jgi:hypothetical protein
MLEALCGNKNIQRILLFLFVNGKCYGTQLHRSLHTALTPIQKALSRLEKGNLITSYCQGKTKIYHFNPAYPLLPELKRLLKKAYTLLPDQEKKKYSIAGDDLVASPLNQESIVQTLLAFWEKLCAVKQLSFHAKTHSKEKSGWSGKGKGEVIITRETDSILLFSEKGVWQNNEGEEITFSNVFRWTLDVHAGVISLEHLRRGPEHAVFLFYLAPVEKNSLSSVDSHQCAKDAYFGHIHFDRFGLRLNWRVIGPKKNEEIDYIYS